RARSKEQSKRARGQRSKGEREQNGGVEERKSGGSGPELPLFRSSTPPLCSVALPFTRCPVLVTETVHSAPPLSSAGGLRGRRVGRLTPAPSGRQRGGSGGPGERHRGEVPAHSGATTRHQPPVPIRSVLGCATRAGSTLSALGAVRARRGEG